MFDTAKRYLWVLKAISRLNLSVQKEVVAKFLTAQKKYLPDEKTEADVKDILKCALCPNMCRFDCPVLQAAKSETFSPAGKARIAYLLEMKRVVSEDAVNLMYACAGCSACQEWCPFDFSVDNLLKGVRKDILKRGMVPPSLLRLKETVEKTHTIYENGSTSLKVKPKEADILYFSGCITLNQAQHIASNTLDVAEKAGVSMTVLPEEWCCGAPLSILGFDNAFKKFAAHNKEVITKGGYKTIVCSCPECVYMFKKVYPEIGCSMNADILHTSQFLLKLAKEGRITLKEHKKEYVYHDPCVLARKLNICEEPRDLLKFIPGLNLKEAQFNKENTHCCGMGGLLAVTNPGISLEIAKNRISQLGEASRTVITACPTCEVAFKQINDYQVLDICELIAALVRES